MGICAEYKLWLYEFKNICWDYDDVVELAMEKIRALENLYRFNRAKQQQYQYHLYGISSLIEFLRYEGLAFDYKMPPLPFNHHSSLFQK